MSEDIYASHTSFDPIEGIIKYTLAEPAKVQIRIGVKDGGPLLRNLIDWEYREAGQHEEIWDGKDDSGVINFRYRAGLMAILICKSPQIGHRPTPKFNINFPDAAQKVNNGIPVVSGLTTLRVSLDKNDKSRVIQEQYEISVFLDNAFLAEGEQGADPFNYKLDTRKLSPGRHLVTINLILFNGEVSSKSQYFEVKN